MKTKYDFENEPYPSNPEDDRILRAMVLIVVAVVAVFMVTGA